MDGIDETRLVGMAEDLAATGYAVVTVAPPDLRQFRITPENTDVLEDAARWLAGRADLAPDGQVGMMGISFSGGLSIVAAGRPGLRDHVAFVLSFGGHGDLIRVMRYLCSGKAPAADPGAAAADITGIEHLSVNPPHDYGVTVVLLTFADRVVPAAPGAAAARRHRHLPARLVAHAGRPAARRSGVRPGADLCGDPRRNRRAR